MYRSVLNADFVLAILEVVKVSNSVLHPVLVITLGEVLTCVRSSALLQQKQINQHGLTTHTHSLLYTHTHPHTHPHTLDSFEELEQKHGSLGCCPVGSNANSPWP